MSRKTRKYWIYLAAFVMIGNAISWAILIEYLQLDKWVYHVTAVPIGILCFLAWPLYNHITRTGTQQSV